MGGRALTEFAVEKAEVRRVVEDYLDRAFNRYQVHEVRNAARYATLGGGHRWRAIVAVAAGRIFRPDALDIVLPGACAVELVHAASLILDDLPSMDDAELRRGKRCTHLVFPRWAVDMAPVFLVTMAYAISLDNQRVSEERRVNAALVLSSAGLEMIDGQSKDLLQEHANAKEEQNLLRCYELKSGALYAAAARAGAILCGATEQQAQSLQNAGMNLGLSYQFHDDVADVVAGVSEVGKNAGMDAGKWTAVDWLGIEGARQKGRQFQSIGLAAVQDFGPEANWLRRLICEASYAAS